MGPENKHRWPDTKKLVRRALENRALSWHPQVLHDLFVEGIEPAHTDVAHSYHVLIAENARNAIPDKDELARMVQEVIEEAELDG